MVALARVGMLGVPMHHHPPVEHAPPAPVEEALVDLLARSSRLAMVHPGVEVRVLAPAHGVEPVENHRRPGPVEGDADPVTHEPAAELHRVRPEPPPGRDARVDVPGMPGRIVLLEEEMVVDARPRLDHDAGERVRELRPRPAAEVVLDDRRLRVLAGEDEDHRMARDVGFSPRREHELDGPLDPAPPGDRNHRPVAEEGAVEGGERVAAAGVVGEVGLQPLGVRREHVGEGLDPDPLRQPAALRPSGTGLGPGVREPPVHEDEPGGGREPADPRPARPRLGVAARRPAARRRIEAEGPALDRPHVRVLPVFVARGGEASFAEAVERFAPHPVDPADARARQRGLRLAPLPPVVIDGRGPGRHAARSSRRCP